MNNKLIPLHESRLPYLKPTWKTSNYSIKTNEGAWVLTKGRTEVGNNKYLSNIVNQVMKDKEIETSIKEAFAQLLPPLDYPQVSPHDFTGKTQEIKLGHLKLKAHANAWQLFEGSEERYNCKYLTGVIELAINELARRSKNKELIKAWQKATETVLDSLRKHLGVLNGLAQVTTRVYPSH
jgi:hypothetical protein